MAEGAEAPAEEENKRATASRWKRFCDICQDVIIAGLAKTAGFFFLFWEGGGGGNLGKRVGKMFSDSRKVPANTGLTNGVHQAGLMSF